jgi:hypothetical protein
MATNAGRKDNPPFGHSLKRLKRRYKIRKPHSATRIHEMVDEVVIAPYFAMRYASHEAHGFAQTLLRSLRLQIRFFRPATDEQQNGCGSASPDFRQRGNQQIEPFIMTEGADETKNRPIRQAKPLC